MNCRFDQELLTGYLDGQLDGGDRTSVEEHIAACSDCLRSLGDLKSVVAMVKTLPHAAAPGSIGEAVRRAAGSPFARARAWMQAAIAAAALVLVAVSVVIVSTRPPADGPVASLPVRDAARPAGESLKNAAPEQGERKRATELKKSGGTDAEEELKENAGKALEQLQKSQDGLRNDDLRKADADEGGRRLELEKNADKKLEEKVEQKEKAKAEYSGGARPGAKEAAPEPSNAPPADNKWAKGDDRGGEKKDGQMAPAAKPNAPAERGKKTAEPAGPPVYVVRSPQLGKTRSEVEAMLADFAKRGANSTVGAPDVGDNAFVKDRCLTVELTEAEFEALQKLLGQMKSVEMASGSLTKEKELSREWRRQIENAEDDRNELADAEKQGAGGGAGKPPAPAKQPAEDPAAPKPKEADKSKDETTHGFADGKGEGPRMGGRSAVARKRYILVFEEKTPPPAAPDKK